MGPAARRCREEERRLPEGVLGVELDPTGVQETQQAREAPLVAHARPREAAAHKGRAPALAPRVGVRLRVEQQPETGNVPDEGRRPQRRVPEPASGLRPGPEAEEGLHARAVPAHHGEDQRREAALVLVVCGVGRGRAARAAAPQQILDHLDVTVFGSAKDLPKKEYLGVGTWK